MLFDEGLVIEVVNPHRFLDLVESGLGRGFGRLAALLQDLIDGRDILLVLFSPGPDRLKLLVEDFLKEPLAFHVSEASFLVMGLELVEVGVIRPVKAEVLVTAERVEVSEHGVALNVARVADIDVEWISVHGHDLLADLVG